MPQYVDYEVAGADQRGSLRPFWLRPRLWDTFGLLWLLLIFVLATISLGDDIALISFDAWTGLIAVGLFWAASALGVFWGMAARNGDIPGWIVARVIVSLLFYVLLMIQLAWLEWYTTAAYRRQIEQQFSLNPSTPEMHEYIHFFYYVESYTIWMVLMFALQALCSLG